MKSSSKIVKVLDLCNFGSFLFVGGVVRDFALKNQSKISQISHSVFKIPPQEFLKFLESCQDVDLSTTLFPKQAGEAIAKAFPDVERKRNFATNSFELNGVKIEVTSTRIDKECDGKNAKMKHGVSFFQDSHRRDFTFNALYLHPNGTIFDFHNGIDDLKNHKINFIGNAKERLMEDFTRIKRYHNFSQRFQMQNPEIEKTINYITKHTIKPIIMR